MKRDKCAEGKFCDALYERAKGYGGSGYGIFFVTLFNPETGKTRTGGASYKKSQKDNGTMLNFCPWCGEKIMWLNWHSWTPQTWEVRA